MGRHDGPMLALNSYGQPGAFNFQSAVGRLSELCGPPIVATTSYGLNMRGKSLMTSLEINVCRNSGAVVWRARTFLKWSRNGG